MGTSIIVVIAAVSLTIVSVGMAIFAYKMAAEAEKRAEAALNTAKTAWEECNEKTQQLKQFFEVLNEKFLETQKSVLEVRALIPEDFKEERMRYGMLMNQINNELEKRAKAEKEWNDTVSSLLNYNVTIGNATGGEN